MGGQGWPSLGAMLAGRPRQLSWGPWKLHHLWEQARWPLRVLLLLHLLMLMLRLLQVSVLLLLCGVLLWGLLIGALKGQPLWTCLLIRPLQSAGMLARMLMLMLVVLLMHAPSGGVVHGARGHLRGGCCALGRCRGPPRGWRGWDHRLLRLSSWVPPPCSPGVTAGSRSSGRSSGRSWGAGARRLLLSGAGTGLQVAGVRAPARVTGRSTCWQHGTQQCCGRRAMVWLASYAKARVHAWPESGR